MQVHIRMTEKMNNNYDNINEKVLSEIQFEQSDE